MEVVKFNKKEKYTARVVTYGNSSRVLLDRPEKFKGRKGNNMTKADAEKQAERFNAITNPYLRNSGKFQLTFTGGNVDLGIMTSQYVGDLADLSEILRQTFIEVEKRNNKEGQHTFWLKYELICQI